jgi:uncharacterized repeat protein (TIGR03803 family)
MTMRSPFVAIVIVVLVGVSGCHSGSSVPSAYLPASSAGAVASAASSITIYSFSGSPLGETPEGGLIFDSAGRLLGTTYFGGTANACGGGCGTIFRLTQGSNGWSETTLHSFQLTDGAYPETDLAMDAAGNLYGTTSVANPLGEAFGLMQGRAGLQLIVLHRFHGGRDGAVPVSGFVLDKHRDLFGTTSGGGTGGSGGNGTVFELVPVSGHHWMEDIVHRFTLVRNGVAPSADLIAGGSGTFYGTTTYGGNSICPAGCGTAFQLKRSTQGVWTSKVLHAFTGSDGASPVGPVVADRAGNLYGTAGQGANGGCFAGCGVVFELQHLSSGHWRYINLHVFNTRDGGGPNGTLVFDRTGNLYGTTVIGGNVNACPQQDGCGVVYRLTPGANRVTWRFTILHIFNNGQDGALPHGGVVMGADGNLYGTTISGGAFSLGTVFEVAP